MLQRHQYLLAIDLSWLTLDNVAVFFAIMGVLATITTSIVAILNYRLSSKRDELTGKANRQIYGEQPWTTAKISPTRWLLIRNHSKPATLYAYRVDNNHNSVQIDYENSAGTPSAIFNRGSYITFTVTGPVGGALSFYYKEYSDAEEADPRDYRGELSSNDTVPDDVLGWSARIR